MVAPGWDIALQVFVAQQEQEQHGHTTAGAGPGALAGPSIESTFPASIHPMVPGSFSWVTTGKRSPSAALALN